MGGAAAVMRERDGSDGYRYVRRLVSVAFADVVGYSRMMSRDEDATVTRWLSIRRTILEPKAKAYRGRLVNAIGDSVLLEFGNVLDAVAWSRDVQVAIRAFNAAQRDAIQDFQLRIAVHDCEIIDEHADIFGDGVNIAARLQAFAPPGGVIVSEKVYDVVRVSLDVAAENLGPLLLKNIPAPVGAYVIDPGSGGDDREGEQREEVLPSIAVLPLRDLSTDALNNYFGDGIVEDIIVSLSGLRELMVISRGSTLLYGAEPADPNYVSQTLGVRYVLVGTVRRTDRAIRLSVKLLDVQGSACVWADTYSAALSELFEVQDDIVGRIVAGIAPNVRAAELRRTMRKKPENFSAYDHTLRAMELIHSLDRDTFMRARGFLEQAIAIDPGFAMPVAWLARWYSLCIGQGWSERPPADADEGVAYAAKAIERDRQNALALATFGHLKSFLFHDYDCAQVYLERARTACPNSALAWTLSSGTASYVGRSADAIKYAERGLRLSPHDRSLFYSYFFLGMAHYAAGDYAEAIKWCRLSHTENPFYTGNLRILGAALAAAQEFDQCRDVVQSLLRQEPGFCLSDYAGSRQPFRKGVFSEAYLEHLRSAGFPA